MFAKRNGVPTPVWIRTGLTDLDYSEVLDGLSPGDSVYVLPSASLVQSQQDMQQRMNQITGGGGVPGMRQQTHADGGGRQPAARRAAGTVAMLLGETFAVALSSIRANALRSMLTMLGIIIGVGRRDHDGGAGQRGAEGGGGSDRGARRQRVHRVRGPGARAARS